VTRTLRLTSGDLRRFAEASCDRNPLHSDEEFARETPYGRCIAHGALVTIAALGASDPATLERAESLNILFKQAVFPDEDYTVEQVRSDGSGIQLSVTRGGRAAAVVTVGATGSESPLPVPTASAAVGRAEPAHYSVAELVEEPPTFDEAYACDLDALSALAADVGAPGIPRAILLWLAAASYTIGMIVPGEHAVFAGARISRATARGSGMLAGAVTTVDDRTGLVVVDVTVEDEGASAQLGLQAFVRTPVPPPDPELLARYLPPSDRLVGRSVLVVGASRGLGAALAGAFAEQGATVWVAYSRSRARAESLQATFGSDRIRLLQFDAEDPVAARAAFERVRLDGTLDGVVLSAAPPLYETSLHPQTSEASLRFVGSSVAAALVPLTEAVDVLDADGWIAVVSSSGLDDPPEPWPHYIVAKAALEGLAEYCRRHVRPRVLVARAPKMWTDSMNTPLGRLGAVPKEQVAAAIVRWALADGDDASRTMTPEDVAALAPEAETV
jgi:NAD(P)-dependent dehydrogenase (short-subunit alcohol dehydrogenase family)/acyl dehydratase